MKRINRQADTKKETEGGTMKRFKTSFFLCILGSFLSIGLYPAVGFAAELWANTMPAINQGLVSGTLPPVGIYGLYDIYWSPFKIYGNDGKSTGAKVDALVQVPVLVWVPDVKFLGASYGVAIAFPFDYTDVTTPGARSVSRWGTFNTTVEPLILSWKLPFHLFVRTGLAVSVNDATSTPGRSSAGGGAPSGNGFWSIEPDFGISWLYNGWALSAGLQYAYNFIDSTTEYKSGQQLAGTYTATKTIEKWTFGVGAYSINQITGDSGAGADTAGCPARGGCKIEAFGIGPLLSYQFGNGANLLFNYTRSLYTRNYLGGNIINIRLIFPLATR